MKNIVACLFLLTTPVAAEDFDGALSSCFANIATMTVGPSLNWITLVGECPQETRNRSLACMVSGQSKEDCGAQNVRMAYRAIGKVLLIRGLSGQLLEERQ